MRTARSLAAAAFCLCLGALPAAAKATTWDAFTAFDGTVQFGAGKFTYLHLIQPSPGVFSVSRGPAVYKNDGAVFTVNTVTVPNDRLTLLLDDAPIFALWTAPKAGEYAVSASFNALDSEADGLGLFEFDPTRTSGPLRIAPLDTVPHDLSYDALLHLDAGQQVGFIIGPGTIIGSDSTGFSFSVSSVPEPAAWSLMVLGVGALGGALRLRRSGLERARRRLA
jgi:hypothetical protein